MAVLLLDSARVESRDRKRAKEEGMCVCVCVRMCTRVQGVLLFLRGRMALTDSLKRRGRFFFANIFSSIFHKVKVELKHF